MEMKILSVDSSDRGGYRIIAGRQTREGYIKHTYAVSPEDYALLGHPTEGGLLMDEDIKIISMGTDRTQAMARAFRILSYSDNNRASLKRKLIEHDHYEENADYVTEEMVRLGYINERAQLDRLVVSYANKKLWGRRNIASHLIAKGYDSGDIHDAIDHAIDIGEIDFSHIKERLLRETIGSSAEERDMKGILYKYGH